MRYKIIYADAFAAIALSEIASAEIASADPRSSRKSEPSILWLARFHSEVVCWPAGYVSEIRASLNLIESHLELLLHGTAPLIAEHAHAYLRKIQRAAEQVRILVQSQSRLPCGTYPDASSSEADTLPAASVDEIFASLDAIEHDLELLLNGHSTLLAEHRNTFLRNIQNAAARMRVNLQSLIDRPEEGGGECDVAARS